MSYTERLAYDHLKEVRRWAGRYPELLGLLAHNMGRLSGKTYAKADVALWVRPGRYWKEPRLGTALLILRAFEKIAKPQPKSGGPLIVFGESAYRRIRGEKETTPRPEACPVIEKLFKMSREAQETPKNV